MSFREKITFSPGGYQPPGGGYPPPGGGGLTPPGGGGPTPPVGVRPTPPVGVRPTPPVGVRPTPHGGTNNDQIRVSPTVRKDERGGSYYEYMEFGHVMGKDNKQIRIDVDRDGGIFLDHGELAQLLETENIQNVITQIESQILNAKMRYQQPGDHRVK